MQIADKKAWVARSFQSPTQLQNELDQIEQAHRDGTLSTAGGWTVGQCLDHCATLIESSYDGFDLKISWPLKLLGRLILKRVITKEGAQIKPGIKLPARAGKLRPLENVSIEHGLEKMRHQLNRIELGERMTHPSPVFGKLTHQQWVGIHMSHCRMHMGFFKLPTRGV